MNIIAVSARDTAAAPAQTLGTLANAMAIGTAALTNLIGQELANVPDVDLESYLATVIINELESQGGPEA